MTKIIYKVDENDNIRVWSMEIDPENPANYRTVSGVLGGKMVNSGYITAKGKNIGKKNETTPERQAELMVERKYKEQLETGYYETIEDARGNKNVVFEAMLAQKYSDIAKKGGIDFPTFSQPKLDGLRCYVKPDGLAYSRNHKEWVTIPHIQEDLKWFHEAFPTIVLDGELYNHSLKHEFEKIVSLTRKTKPGEEDIMESARMVEFHIFDYFDYANPHENFEDRIAFLMLHFGKNQFPMIKVVETTKHEDQFSLDAVYAEYMENGFEGQMVRTGGPYEMKRSKTLLKRKEFEDKEFIVDRVEEGQGNWAGAVKRVYIRLEDGAIQKSGIDGNYDYLKNVLAEHEEYANGQATVRFQGRTNDGLLRFPVVKMLWKGKRDV